jgi:hypothetical protein
MASCTHPVVCSGDGKIIAWSGKTPCEANLERVANCVGLPKDLTTEITKITEKTSKKTLWTLCSL